jgi:hypothetical protein
MALWERERQGHTIGLNQLIHHSDAGSPKAPRFC